jgi:arylsulfatase A-like enzyme
MSKATPVGGQQGTVLPYPDPPFRGKVGRLVKDSVPDFPKAVEPPKGAPNVLLIMTDDVGFGASSAFGGPIPTPAFDRVGKSGLRYTMFHTTALCSPTRAALITGRNHHTCASGSITEMATGFSGYNSVISKTCGTVGQVLRHNAFNTAWFGKMHNVPDWMSSKAGPYDLWPTGLGFEYFYGFLGGDCNNWYPALYQNIEPIEPYIGKPDYVLNNDLAQNAIAWMRMQHAVAPTKPWLLYYVPGSAHAPHHAPKEWTAKFKGKFNQGWDKVREETLARQKQLGIVPQDTKLTERPSQIPAWDSLSPDQKRLYARMMEVYAAALAHADHEIGRVIDAIEGSRQLDNTLIFYLMGDNGASAEGSLQGATSEPSLGNNVPEDMEYLLSMIDELGGPLTYGHYPVGWAHAMDSPMQWTKQVASHFGGTRNGLAISWPARIKDAGALRRQFCHVIDIVPTIYEAVGVTAPAIMDGVEQKPIAGTSMLYTFDNASAPSRHTAQYFEICGNRAIYKDGWIASTTPLRLPWEVIGSDPSPDDFKWELYHVDEDFSQANDLAQRNPQKLKELQDAFEAEAKKHDVYPLDSSFAERADPSIRPSLSRGRSEFVFYPGLTRIPEGSAPDFKNKSFSVAAEIEVPSAGADGVLATMGGRFGGWGLFVLDGKLQFAYALSNQAKHKYRTAAKEPLSPGKHTVRVDFIYDGGGIGKGGAVRLWVDQNQVAQGRVDRTVLVRFSLDETFDIGADTGTPVVEDYADKMPFAYQGALHKVFVVLQPEKLDEKDRQRLLAEMARAALAVH